LGKGVVGGTTIGASVVTVVSVIVSFLCHLEVGVGAVEHDVGEQTKAEVAFAGEEGVAECIGGEVGGEDVGCAKLPPHPRTAGDGGHD
jgi:hypothetical protein